jgi:hypothetical protein
MLMDDLKDKALKPIARLARTLLPEDPNLADRVKDAKLNSYGGVIMFARNLIERAEPNKAKFVEAGLKENFLDSLRADVAKFQKVLEEKDLSFRLRSGATAALEKELVRARRLVRVIDAMLTAEWKESNPNLLAQWKTVSRFPSSAQEEASAPVVTPMKSVAGGSGTASGGGDVSPDRHVV